MNVWAGDGSGDLESDDIAECGTTGRLNQCGGNPHGLAAVRKHGRALVKLGGRIRGWLICARININQFCYQAWHTNGMVLRPVPLVIALLSTGGMCFANAYSMRMNSDCHTELHETDAPAPVVAALPPPPSTGTVAQRRARGHARVVIVVVEDDPQLLLLLWDTLEQAGYEAVPTEHGMAALAYLGSHPPPACLLLDLDMSVMNGWALRRVLQQDPRLADIPVVLVSGLANVAETAAKLGAVAYLRKPFTVEQLLAVLP